jgi:hypothetical protein
MMTSLAGWLEVIEEFPSSAAIRESLYGYPALLSVHVVSMCLFAGLVLMMDLRLAGIGNRGTPFSQIQKRLFPWQMVGLVVSTISGLILVYGQPTRFSTNIFFLLKMVLMALAAMNALAFHFSPYLSIDRWDASRLVPRTARSAGLLSVALWVGVIVTGRLIAYNWFEVR